MQVSPYHTVLQRIPITREMALVIRQVPEEDLPPLERPGLTESERELRELRERDREVREHEQAHVRGAGPHVLRGPNYNYAIGSDGRPYAVGGEVWIDLSPVPGDPLATLAKARALRAASVAGEDSSPQDLAASMLAGQMESEALQELAREREKGDKTHEPGQLFDHFA